MTYTIPSVFRYRDYRNKQARPPTAPALSNASSSYGEDNDEDDNDGNVTTAAAEVAQERALPAVRDESSMNGGGNPTGARTVGGELEHLSTFPTRS